MLSGSGSGAAVGFEGNSFSSALSLNNTDVLMAFSSIGHDSYVSEQNFRLCKHNLKDYSRLCTVGIEVEIGHLFQQ